MKDRATQAEKELATAQTKQTELRERLDERTKARDSLREQLATVQEKLQAQNQRAADVSAELARTKAQMVAQETSLKGQLGKTETERDTLRKQLETARGQVEAGKQRDGQLALSREEMLRAEGQIELIKDLLLRGPDL
ncbi:hypothetical protein GQR58_028137 [Nymphon striatum]|nr:hypothetical protein GQR58_028137 [Nymphon striatum]